MMDELIQDYSVEPICIYECAEARRIFYKEFDENGKILSPTVIGEINLPFFCYTPADEIRALRIISQLSKKKQKRIIRVTK